MAKKLNKNGKEELVAGWGLTVEQKHFLKEYIEDGEIVEAEVY